jgi:hypothetical protein
MPKQVPWWLAVAAIVLAWLLNWLFGPKAYWEWQRTTVQLTAERTKASADIRDRLRILLAEIIKFQNDPDYREKNKIQFNALIDDYNALERGLAELEGRQPVKYGFQPRLGTGTLSIKPGP